MLKVQNAQGIFLFQVPCVFINGEFVGGGTETKTLQKDGKLLGLISECKFQAK